jgi:hypothetical protein
METPKSDEVSSQPRRDVATGCNLLFFAIFLLLLAGVAYIAWNRNPPDVPNPSATANPATLPPTR